MLWKKKHYDNVCIESVLHSYIKYGVTRATDNGKHQDNMSVIFTPPYTPLLYSKTGVYRGIHYFLIFALKQRLWVLVQ